jgi:hypothetical protein
VIKKIHTIEPLPSIKAIEPAKPVFPYIEFYNSQKRHKKKTPVFLLNYHQKLFSLNRKLKAKELAHFHQHTLQSSESILSLSTASQSISNRKSRYLNNKELLVSKSLETKAKKEKNFEKLFVVGLKNIREAKETLPSHFKLPSLNEVFNARIN